MSIIQPIPKEIVQLVPPFTGDSKTLNLFLRKCQYIYDQYKGSEEQNSYIFNVLTCRLMDDAAALLSEREDIVTWPALKELLIEHFGDPRDEACIYFELESLRMKQGETYHAFCNRIKSVKSLLMSKISNIENAEMKRAKLEIYNNTALNVFFYNLPENIVNIVRLKAPKTLDAALRIVLEELSFFEQYYMRNGIHKNIQFGYKNIASNNVTQPNTKIPQYLQNWMPHMASQLHNSTVFRPQAQQSNSLSFGSTNTVQPNANTSVSIFGSQSQPLFGNPPETSFGSTPTTFGGALAKTFGSAPATSFGKASATPFGIAPRDGGARAVPFGGAQATPFGAAQVSTFGSKSATSFGGAPATSFGVAQGTSFGGAQTTSFGSKSATSFGGSPAKCFGSPSAASFVSAPATAVDDAPATSFGSTQVTSFKTAPQLCDGSSFTELQSPQEQKPQTQDNAFTTKVEPDQQTPKLNKLTTSVLNDDYKGSDYFDNEYANISRQAEYEHDEDCKSELYDESSMMIDSRMDFRAEASKEKKT